MTAGQWMTHLKPLFKEYRRRKHPLDYKNPYQLLVMVVLSAQSSDVQINRLAPAFFEKYPDLTVLSKASPQDLFPYLRQVRNFANKSKWLTGIAARLAGRDTGGNPVAPIPTTMDELTDLPGIGRKSASVIIRESGGTAEGIVVDLHVIRVAPRLGLSQTGDPAKIERDLMALIPKASWNDAGMSLSFLGRDICRPTNPLCHECMLSSVCVYYLRGGAGAAAKKEQRKPAKLGKTALKRARPRSK